MMLCWVSFCLRAVVGFRVVFGIMIVALSFGIGAGDLHLLHVLAYCVRCFRFVLLISVVVVHACGDACVVFIEQVFNVWLCLSRLVHLSSRCLSIIC